MAFKPTYKPPAVNPKNWQRLVVNLQAHERDLRDRIEIAARAAGLTVSQFCREAIKYAIDHMEAAE